jgi:hypothetical protein
MTDLPFAVGLFSFPESPFSFSGKISFLGFILNGE